MHAAVCIGRRSDGRGCKHVRVNYFSCGWRELSKKAEVQRDRETKQKEREKKHQMI